MYIVVNISKGILSITDMKIEIPPNQSRDLHKIPTLIPPEKSKDLKRAIALGHAKEVKRDIPSNEHEEKVVHETKIVKESINKDEIVDALFERLKKEMIVDKPQQDSLQSELLMKLISKVEKMDNSIKAQKSISPPSKEDEATFEEIDVDPDLLQKIHAKAVEKLTKNTEAGISYEQKEEKGKSLLEDMEEIEDLI